VQIGEKMPKSLFGGLLRGGVSLILAAGMSAVLGSGSFAQDREVPATDSRQPVYTTYTTPEQGVAVPGYHPRFGGPYKGFYPCNGKTPNYGGACYVYGDAPLYTAPANYGHHCALWCP
jgi:hypothetical protein